MHKTNAMANDDLNLLESSGLVHSSAVGVRPNVKELEVLHNTLLEVFQLIWHKGVRLRDDRNHIDDLLKRSHGCNIERLEPNRTM